MNKTFFTILLLVGLGVVGYKYYYKGECASCSRHSITSTSSVTTDAPIISLTTTEELNSLLENTTSSFIKLYLDGCPPCEEAARVYPEIAQQFPHINFYNLNVTNTTLMNALVEKNVIEAPITAAPTFLYIKNGKAVEILQGFNSKENLIEHITILAQ